jgi:glycerophosphoryl diester phosphodiesterase
VSNHSHPLILGHRGASVSAPDNSLKAYSLAVTANADGIELDVRRTADGAMILHHDAHADPPGRFVDLSFAEIRAAAPEVPTLDEMLAVTGDLLLDVEIKNSENDPDHDPEHHLADQVVAWIAQHQLHRRVIVSSFNWDTVSRVRALDPTVPTGQLIAGLGEMTRDVDAVAASGHQWILPANMMLGNNAHEQIAVAHEAGLRVMVWTVDEPDRMIELAAARIDGIITNDPALAHTTLAG